MKKIFTRHTYVFTIIVIVLLWQVFSSLEILPSYIIPSPVNVIKSLITDAPLLFTSSLYTMLEAGIGLLLSVVFGVIIAIVMEMHPLINNAIYPLILFTQTIPTIAVAPLFILWFGFGLLPKVLLVFITCFFPITMSVYAALNNVDARYINMLKTFGATKKDTYLHVKLPFSLPSFFSALKISSSYAIISAVVSEWLGGNHGLGVYMTRVRKSFNMDKMFASIIIIAAVSMGLTGVISIIQKKVMPWAELENENL